MSENVCFASYDDVIKIARALDSELRCKILHHLCDSKLNIKQLCEKLQIPQSTCVMNVQILEKAGLLITEQLPADFRGSQKLCSLRYEKVLLPLIQKSVNPKNKIIETEMPIGLFSDFQAHPPCGILSETSIIGFYDSTESFFHPQRAGAALIWLSHGFLEYRFPKNFSISSKIQSICFSAEICSEYPGHNVNWPSDITVWINNIEIGTWTSPGDMGGKRGVLTPNWWNSEDSQYGFLKKWEVKTHHSYIDGKEISKTGIDDLHLHEYDAIIIRIGVKESALNRGGINVFGSKFGNYAQDVILSINLD